MSISTSQFTSTLAGATAILEIKELSTWLRKEAIAGAMATSSPDVVATICEDYPQELVWAVVEQQRSDYLPVILDMVDDYRDDPYLLRWIVDGIARLGTASDLEYALYVAATALRSDAEPAVAAEPVAPGSAAGRRLRPAA